MKNNFNPYTVPEDFFGTMCEQSVAKYRGRRHALRIGVAAMAAAALILIIPFFSATDRGQEQEPTVNNLAGMYEYDIFLQVNFTK